MDKRQYNIFFDLHTVSGIVLSVLLFVIFFAGSLSFFRDETVNWERNENHAAGSALNVDVDAVIDTLSKKYDLYGREVEVRRGYEEQRIMVYVSESKDTTNKQAGEFFYMNTNTFKTYNYENSYSLGEFLYRLHFFAQIPYPAGYYLSGFTALFLLFIVLTGLLVHWKKIISNFFLFRPWAKLKTVWTDAHTALGMIGLPFQVVYAVTGAFFMINAVLLIPTVMVFYDGDENKVYKDLGYAHPTFTYEGKKQAHNTHFNELIAATSHKWRAFHVKEVHIFNFGDAGMHAVVSGELDRKEKFTGEGSITFKCSNSEIISSKDPYDTTSYLSGVKGAMYKLHFGDYGGYLLKVASFLMGLLSCIVVLSGVLVWLEARNKKNIPEKKRRFNQYVGYIYMSICMTMIPITALSFIATKLFPEGEGKMNFIYAFYFVGWLILAVAFVFKRNNLFTSKYTLLAGGVIGAFIPILTGVTNGWLWNNVSSGKYDFVVVDLLWIGLSTLSIYIGIKLKPRPADHNAVAVSQRELVEAG